MAVVKWYRPTIGDANWNIKEMPKEERENLRNRLVMGKIDNFEDYQTVIGYLYKKFAHYMDITGTFEDQITGKRIENTAIQWKFAIPKNNTGMYAFVYYDKERDYEPVAFAGSYFQKNFLSIINLLYDNELDNFVEITRDDPKGFSTSVGNGIVMWVDPNYRRLGLGEYSWQAEAALYRDIIKSDPNNKLGIKWPLQKEIQNEFSVKSTISCFPETDEYLGIHDNIQDLFGGHNKHLFITSTGRVKNDGTHAQIRLIMNYEDENMIKTFNSMPENMKNIYGNPYWNFLEREKFTKEELISLWN